MWRRVVKKKVEMNLMEWWDRGFRFHGAENHKFPTKSILIQNSCQIDTFYYKHLEDDMMRCFIMLPWLLKYAYEQLFRT